MCKLFFQFIIMTLRVVSLTQSLDYLFILMFIQFIFFVKVTMMLYCDDEGWKYFINLQNWLMHFLHCNSYCSSRISILLNDNLITETINNMVYKKSPNLQKMAKSTIFIKSKVFLVETFTENT